MKGVQLTKLVQELGLHNLTPEIDLSEIVIKTAEINRPALQLAGYFEHFEEKRVQIIGYVEYTYLMQLSDEERKFKYERFISSKIPCVIFSTMTRPSQDMIDLAVKYNVPTFVTERTTSSFMAEIIRQQSPTGGIRGAGIVPQEVKTCPNKGVLYAFPEDLKIIGIYADADDI